MVELRRTLDTFENSAVRQLYKVYGDLIGDLSKVIASKTSTSFSVGQAKILLQEVQQTLEVIAERLTIPASEAIGYAGEYAYLEMNKIVSWDYKYLGFNSVQLTAFQIQQMVVEQKLGGKTLGQWMGSAFIDVDTILPEIQKGIIKGESYAKIVSRIDNAIMGNHPKQHIDSIVKTYIQSVNVKAQEEVYEANKDIVKEMEWSAIMEGGNTKTGRGTCPRCAALDGQRWSVSDKSKPYMPLHVRCRCVWAPITITWKELGFDVPEMEEAYQPWVDRAGKDRALDDYGFTDKNYKDWWWSRGKAFQDNAIGPMRANLVRGRKIKFEDIIDDKGNLILIKDLI